MKRLILFWILVSVLCGGVYAQAQEKPDGVTVKPEATTKPAVAEEEPVKNRIRSGSYLVGNRGIEPATDTRGDFERRRDLELIKHYTRRAQLDVIARRAKQIGQTQYLERLDRIRRIEDERHRLRMKEITEGSMFLEMRGLP